MNDQDEKKLSFINKILFFIKNVWLDTVASFKYNNMKLPGILICIPGVMLGFFINFHYSIIKMLSYKVEGEPYINEAGQIVSDIIELIPDFSAICFFGLILFGVLNIFTGFSCINKKNLGSVISATLTTTVIVLLAGIYLYYIFFYYGLQQQGIVNSKTPINITSLNFIMVMISVIVSVITSVVGVILSFRNYDRNYNKKDKI